MVNKKVSRYHGKRQDILKPIVVKALVENAFLNF